MSDARVCRVCGQEKAVTEFGVDKSQADGLNPRCKECNAAHARAWHARNGERASARSKEYRAKHRERINEKDRAYRQEKREWLKARKAEILRSLSPEELERRRTLARERNRRYAASHREQIAEKNRAWHLERDQERARQLQREWKARNRERVAADNHQRRRRRTLSEPDREFIGVLHYDPCAYCGAAAEAIDHVDPLVRGGDVGWSNLTSSCKSCNSRKAARPLLTALAHGLMRPRG